MRRCGSPQLAMALAAGLLLCAGTASRSETIALSVSPPLIEMTMAQGGDRSFEVTLTNDGDRLLQARVLVVDLTLNREGDPVTAPAGTSAWSLAPWVTVDAERVALQPAARKVIRCRLRVPRGQAGGRYGALLFAADQRPEIAATGMRVETRTGAVLMLTVARTERIRADVSEVRAEPGEGGSLIFTAAVHNAGNVHFRASGGLLIRGPDGRVAARLALEGGTGTVLPDGTRDFVATWNPRRLPPGDYTVEARFSARGLQTVRRTVEFSAPLVSPGEAESIQDEETERSMGTGQVGRTPTERASSPWLAERR